MAVVRLRHFDIVILPEFPRQPRGRFDDNLNADAEVYRFYYGDDPCGLAYLGDVVLVVSGSTDHHRYSGALADIKPGHRPRRRGKVDEHVARRP